MDILFENAKVITMCDDEPYIENAYVAIEGRKIAYVGKSRPNTDAKRLINASGKVLMPGIVNTHTHIPMTVFRGLSDDCELSVWLNEHIWPAEDKLTPEKVRAGASLAAAEMIASGTTSFSDSYFFTDEIADAVEESGMKANLSRSLVGNGENFENDERVAEAKRLTERVHMADGGRLRADVSIHAEYTSEPLLRKKAAHMARENGQVLQIHMSETKSENEACIKKYGKTPAMLFKDEGIFDGTSPLLAHCCFVSEDDIEIMKNADASVAHCPVSNLKLASGIAPVCKMLAKNVNVTLGTDGTASNNNLDMYEEVKLLAILHKGALNNPTAIDAYTALKCATVNGAKAQGRTDCGMIKAGLEADIIMLDFDRPHLIPCHNAVSNVVYSAHGSDVVMNIVSGRILYENGEFKTIDKERIMRAVRS